MKAIKHGLVLKGFAYLFSERLIRLSVGFFVHALVARHLGPERFGEMAYAMKVVGIFATFSLFGVDEIILHHLIGQKYGHDDVFKTTLRLRLLSACVGYFLLLSYLLIAHWGETERITWILVYGLQIFVLCFSLFDLKFQSVLNFKPLFIANNISSLSASGLRVLGVVLQKSTYFFLMTYLAGDMILRLVVQWKAGFQLFKGKIQPELFRDIFRTSLPYFFSAFVILLDQRISFIFIERFLSTSDVGHYSIAVTLVDLWLFIPMAACSTLFPGIVSAYGAKTSDYLYKIQNLSGMVIWSALIFILVFIAFSHPIMGFMYGAKYQTADSIVKLYSLTTIPLFFNLVRTKWMALERNLTDWLGLSILALVTNTVLHAYLVPRLGIPGAIYSYLASQILSNLVFSFFSADIRRSLFVLGKTAFFPVYALRKIKGGL